MAVSVVRAPSSTPPLGCGRMPAVRAMPRKSSTIWRLEQLLPHRGQQVGAAGERLRTFPSCLARSAIASSSGASDAGVELRARLNPHLPAVPVEARDRLSCRISACRFGPLPLKHSEPPCSRNFAGAVGSTPSVRFNALGIPLRAQRRQHALRREWRLVQTNPTAS